MVTGVAAVIGGGVIGGGWAARFLLNGWDVRVFDTDPQAERRIGEVLANARRSLPALHDHGLGQEGQLSFHGTVAEAVEDARWVQESVPERLDLKHKVYGEILTAVSPDTVIGSSTSGFKPSQLQAVEATGLGDANQILVTHPFNPVYLLPLVEVVPSERTCPEIRDRAIEIIFSLGMQPLLVRQEIDAHLADRFLEAIWREALWLVRDGVATTEEIDDAIRYGFGLRFAQMGLFESYRIAGGEAGMRHFIAQFGPALQWPWTKLTDVPELDEALIERIAEQSDAQSGHHSIRDLERIRDDNLVGILRALKRNGQGAGRTLASFENRLLQKSDLDSADVAKGELLLTVHRTVPQSWTDYNGHMNEAFYLEVFAQANDRLMEVVGADMGYIATGRSYFTAEAHIRYLDEVNAGEEIKVKTQLLVGRGKKLHCFHFLHREDDRVAATGEHVMLHVDLATRKTSEPPSDITAKMAKLTVAHEHLPLPEGAGRAIVKK